MKLSPGHKLGPYEIVDLIGRGGKGEVYRGTDTRLGRPVAIKVSSRDFNDRFEREAIAISALNHPNNAARSGPADAHHRGDQLGSGAQRQKLATD
jgi:serine/threonine protein kinase